MTNLLYRCHAYLKGRHFPQSIWSYVCVFTNNLEKINKPECRLAIRGDKYSNYFLGNVLKFSSSTEFVHKITVI